ncbi:MAG: PBP1A family penicillin-binding protein [Elusimicrobia bacterium]|nr:PBP1A family penicillin-binding protein [Elusimicrobiota bacterium]
MRLKRGRTWALAALLALSCAGAGVVGLVLYAETRLSDLVLGGLGFSFPTKVYSAPYILRPGLEVPAAELLERLRRLRYEESDNPAPGQFSWAPPALTVNLRGFTAPTLRQEAGIFRLIWSPDRGWKLEAPAGEPASLVALEPELMAELSGPQKVRRELARPEEFPRKLKLAVLAAEDKRFYTHSGVDPRAIARALWSNLARKGPFQGASTITQQLSKNIFLSPRRTLRRKLAEAGLSLYLELRFSKEKILALYLNHIYLGQDGPVSVAGMKAAANFYFARPLKELSLAQNAALAGLIRSPHQYNPRQNPAAAKSRRDWVLRQMRREGFIGQQELDAALAEALAPAKEAPGRKDKKDEDYFTAELVRQILPRYGEDALFRQGLSLYTTMDPLLQRAAQKAVSSCLHQAALVALDPASGKVLALSGGKDFAQSQFNRATQALRQPGSAFKPFVYGAALEKGMTPATVLNDILRSYPGPRGKWSPENYDGHYRGTVTVRQALAQSLNAATLDLAEKTGMGAIRDFAQKMGVSSPLDPSLAMALGASELSLLELTAAYAPFANGGFRVQPGLVAAVTDAEGAVLEWASWDRSPVVDPALAYLAHSLLESVVKEGTAKSLESAGLLQPAAGKTGTTNDGRDAWFIGYTPQILAGVWVGEDNHKPIHATGAKDALPIWARFMEESLRQYPRAEFPRPQGLVWMDIDPVSGLKAHAGCPQRRSEVFLEGSQPKEFCPLHPRGVVGWFKRFFGK